MPHLELGAEYKTHYVILPLERDEPGGFLCTRNVHQLSLVSVAVCRLVLGVSLLCVQEPNYTRPDIVTGTIKRSMMV